MLAFALALAIVPQVAEPAIDWDKEFGVEEQVRDPETGELPVEPYVEDNANAGAEPFANDKMAALFGGPDGIRKIAERTVELSEEDPRISAVFVAQDTVRLKRVLFEQFCYLLDAGCDYSGRDMRATHASLGIRHADLNALVENLQSAMREQRVPFAAQNRFLAKLAPMSPDVVTR